MQMDKQSKNKIILKKVSFTTSIEDLRDMGLFSVRTYNGCQTNGCLTVRSLVELTQTDILRWKGCGKKVAYEILDLIEALRNSNLLPSLENKDSNCTSELYFQPLRSLRREAYYLSIIEGLLAYRMESGAVFDEDKLRSIYNDVRSMTNNNECETTELDHIVDKLELFSKTEMGTTMKERGDVLSRLVQEAAGVIETINQDILNANIKTKALTFIGNIDSDLTLKSKFPFLTEDELLFCRDYIKIHSSLPKLYLLHKNLIRSSERQAIMLCLRYGMYSDGIEKSLDDIAEQFFMSRERVRQLTDSDGLAIKKISPKELIEESDFSDIFFLSEDDESVDNMIREQNLSLSPKQLLILIDILSKRLGSKSFSKEGKYYLFDWNIYNKVNFERLKDFIKEQVPYKRTESVKIPLDLCIAHVCKKTEVSEIITIKALIRAFLKDIFNVDPEADETYYWEQTHASFQDVLEIVAEKDRIVTKDEIINECAEQFPELKCSYDAIYQNPLITSVGLKGYVPTSQRSRYFASIGDCAAAVLELYDEPLSIPDLLSEIEEKGYVTTDNSLRSLLARKEENRFIRFTGDLWGLSSKKYGDLDLKFVSPVKRKSLEIRLMELEKFIDLNKRMPNLSQSDEEASMWRWLKNIEKGVIPISDEQKLRVDKILEESSNLPQNQREMRFLQNCIKYREVVEFLGHRPSSESRPQLCLWFYSSLHKDNLPANSKRAFNELLQWLEDKGVYYS